MSHQPSDASIQQVPLWYEQQRMKVKEAHGSHVTDHNNIIINDRQSHRAAVVVKPSAVDPRPSPELCEWRLHRHCVKPRHWPASPVLPSINNNDNNNSMSQSQTPMQSHTSLTVSTPGAAAHQAAQHKIAKYSKLASTHMYVLPHCLWCRPEVSWFVFNGTFSTNKLHCAVAVWNISCRADTGDRTNTS